MGTALIVKLDWAVNWEHEVCKEAGNLVEGQRIGVQQVEGVHKDLDALPLLQPREEGHPPHAPVAYPCR